MHGVCVISTLLTQLRALWIKFINRATEKYGRIGRLEGYPTAWTENWKFTLERLKLIVASGKWREAENILRGVPHYGLHYLLYNTLDEYREFAEAYGKEWRETLETYLASQAITYYLRYALSEGRIPDLTSLPSTAALHALSTMSGIDVFSRLAAVNKQRGRGITAAKGLPGASEAMGYVSEWVKFILKERMAPVPKKSPYLELAAWLVATARYASRRFPAPERAPSVDSNQ
ncbi:hypothetical protein [Pyrobaculum sp.]|uniref:hypothetical protein n=1 Tax=Pyrobaculum sp. TaxID=2004705 RepID=UPI0031817DB4